MVQLGISTDWTEAATKTSLNFTYSQTEQQLDTVTDLPFKMSHSF